MEAYGYYPYSPGAGTSSLGTGMQVRAQARCPVPLTSRSRAPIHSSRQACGREGKGTGGLQVWAFGFLKLVTTKKLPVEKNR